jgi:para-aminobenzoate synthetase/4-amino-4-deoxychorismate lyase
MNSRECFALLDDASNPEQLQSRSRLYTGHTATLHCSTIADWPHVLAEMQRALDRGLHAVPLLTYELGAAMRGVAAQAIDGPLAQVLLFDRCQFLNQHDVAQWLAARISSHASPSGIARIRANVDEGEFTAALKQVHDYIEAGHTYQVNYTFRLRFDAFGSLPALYTRLRARQPVPYGALVALPDGSGVLSLSPELFARHSNGELLTRPMKGTAPASDDPKVNLRRADALANDPKNRAENLMIVDLLRNDLGRVAKTGTVEVPALFEVTRFSRVLQMTSSVRCQLREGVRLQEVFDAIYPCGSITGAPKHRTMEIIHELEAAPRGLYTGAIGWFEPPRAAGQLGDFCMSVPIRTLSLGVPLNGVRKGEMGVGSGIVFDSQPADEFAECQLKARFLTGLENDFELFETMYATAEGCRSRDLHLSRMARSAEYFGIPFSHDEARKQLDVACTGLSGPTRMRLALSQDGSFRTSAAALDPIMTPVGIVVAVEPLPTNDVFLRHKTTVRARYDQAWRDAERVGAFDTVFFNEQGELAEGGRSNVFVKLDGRWYTPPLSSGVLPGIMRMLMLLDPAWDATERVITRAMFERAEEIVVCNSLRGALPARLR